MSSDLSATLFLTFMIPYRE